MLQERLFDDGAKSAESLPHGPHRAGAGAKGGSVDPGLVEFLVDEALRRLSILHERDFVRKVRDARVKCGGGGVL